MAARRNLRTLGSTKDLQELFGISARRARRMARERGAVRTGRGYVVPLTVSETSRLRGVSPSTVRRKMAIPESELFSHYPSNLDGSGKAPTKVTLKRQVSDTFLWPGMVVVYQGHALVEFDDGNRRTLHTYRISYPTVPTKYVVRERVKSVITNEIAPNSRFKFIKVWVDVLGSRV